MLRVNVSVLVLPAPIIAGAKALAMVGAFRAITEAVSPAGEVWPLVLVSVAAVLVYVPPVVAAGIVTGQVTVQTAPALTCSPVAAF